MKVHIKVKPNSNQQKIVDFGNFRYLIYVKAPAEDNKANIEMINAISKHLGVPPKSIKITFGASGEDKILDVG